MTAQVINLVPRIKPAKQTDTTNTPDAQLQDQFRLRRIINKNPKVWELIEFWIDELSMAEVEILYDSIAPYYRNITVQDETLQKLYSVLTDDQKVTDLVKAELNYWASLSAKKERPWKDLFHNYWKTKSPERRENRIVYDPLFTPAYEFSAGLVKIVLLLRFLFRQEFPKTKSKST